ncbi:MAG: hypothetical protein M1281_03610 [Chloroflexi bacterium]|nr:hypothetical protein [Chloroflexota bacterium]
MALRTWQSIKSQYCPHAEAEVYLEAEVVYPAEWLPEQPARVLAHRCSRGVLCNQNSSGGCVWSGTNPSYDPFSERA